MTGNLVVSFQVDARPFIESTRTCMVALWAILYGKAYDRATARVVTRIG